jgi:hypothetical protein
MSKTVADVQGRRSRTMAQFADSVVICSRTRFSVATGMSANGTKETNGPALRDGRFRPGSRPAAHRLGGRLVTRSGH